MKRKNREERKERRKERARIRRSEAEDRNKLRAKKTPEEQLALLDERLGPNQGAGKERARLEAIIAK